MRPRSIAVVGASQRGGRANRVIRTLQAVGFDGPIYPINPNYPEVMGLPCYPDLAATPTPADCAVVAIPAARAADVLEGAVAAGVRSAVVLAAGFGESGEEGRVLQGRLETLAREGLVVCGPNCFGILNVHDRIAPFIGVIPIPLLAGNVGLVSQSGGLTNVIVPPLMARGVGFSHVVSCGNQAGATIEDYLAWLVGDERTRVIAAFVEGFRRPGDLPAIAARARAAGKPIVILKVGRSELARTTAMAHTASIVGSAEAVDALFRQHGIIGVRGLDELIETLALLSLATERGTDGWGPRVGVITGTGGLMAYLGDAAAEIGITLPALDAGTRGRLEEILPGFVAAANPLDGTGAMFEDPDLFPAMVTRLAASPAIDVVGAHLDFNPPNRDGLDTARRQFVPDLARVAPELAKPVVAFTARAGSLPEGEVSKALKAAGVTLLDGVEPALSAIRNISTHARRTAELRAADEKAAVVAERQGVGLGRREQGKPADLAHLADLPPGWLASRTAFELIRRAGIRVPARGLAASADEAASIAGRIGYPVVLKVESAAIQHKSEAGGVLVGLASAAAVRDGYRGILRRVREAAPSAAVDGVVVEELVSAGLELLLSVRRDPDLGPVVAVGMGGVYVEVLSDVAVGIPPLTRADATAMLRRLRGWPLLDGVRGRPGADVDAVIDAVLAVADLSRSLGDRLAELEINPLVAPPAGGTVALDVLVRLA